MSPADRAARERVWSYLPRVVVQWLATDPDQRARTVDASLLFADLSGFTALSERLARRGRIGAEIVAETISACFTRLLAGAYTNGGSLLKFGGDALLLLFTGPDHCRRACRAAVGMRRELRAMGAVDAGNGRVRLRMSIGVHSGPVHLFLVGDTHRELIVTGAAATEVVAMESLAERGEIVVSPAVAGRLEPTCLGASKAHGTLLRREPPGLSRAPRRRYVEADVDTLVQALPTWQRQQVMQGVEDPQHRNVAVAFLGFEGCDAVLADVGMAGLAEELDALVGDVQAAAQRHGVTFLASDIARDGGKIVLTAGAPVTSGHDDDRLLVAVKQVVETPRRLRMKVGVNAGSVFAGDVGPGYRRSYSVMGDTVNLAARVMAQAATQTVLATQAVIDRCTTRFELTPVEPFTVKGKSAPVKGFTVGAVRGRMTDERPVRPLVGRDAELAALLDAWAACRRGEGRVVTLVGEPGIGKSRLVEELRRAADARVLDLACEPSAADRAYFPIRSLLLQAMQLNVTAGEEEITRSLDRLVDDRAPALRPWLPLLGLVLGVDMPLTREVAELGERFRRPRLEEVVVALLRRILDAPTMVIIEDAHWMDEASSQLLERALRDVPLPPWFVCVTRRDVKDGLVPPSADHVQTLQLRPLLSSAAAALMDMLVDHGVFLSDETMNAVVARAGGNPLFLAELVAAAERSGGLEDLPDSLEGVILARIDALGPQERSLLRRLSALGPSFASDLARDVLGADFPDRDHRVWRGLADFLDLGDFAEIRFRQALVVDGAYRSLPYRVRERLHRAIGEGIERRAADAAADQAEVLSLHFYNARRYDKAWRYSNLAAEHARAVYANVQAARFYERALDAARRGAWATTRELVAVNEALGDIYRRIGRLEHADGTYRRARRLAPNDPVVSSRLMMKQAAVRQQAGDFPQALRRLRRAERMLDAVDGMLAGRQRAQVAVARASVAKDQGRPSAVVRWCQDALRVAQRIDDKDASAHAYFLLDHGYVALGRPELAHHSDLALRLYEELDDLWGQGAVLNNLGGHAYWAGRWDEAVEYYERGRTAFGRIGDVANAALGLVNVGEIRSDQGHYAEAERLSLQALRISEHIGDKTGIAYILSNLGRLATRRRTFDDALRRLRQALDMAMSLGLGFDATEASLRIAECLCHRGVVNAAFDDVVAGLTAREATLTPAQLALLNRVTGFALLQQRKPERAHRAFEASLSAARRADSPYEIALSLRALGHLTATTGGDPRSRFAEAKMLLDRLGVVHVAEPAALDPPLPVIPTQQEPGETETLSAS